MPATLPDASLVACVSRIYARGWCEGTGGNYSVRLGRDPLRLLLTRSGLDKGRISTDDLLVIGPDARTLEGTEGTPSAEALLHVALARDADAGAVLHTHSVWSTLLGEHFLAQGGLTIGGYEMLKGIEGVDTHEAEVFVPVVANAQDMRALSGEVLQLLEERPGLRGFVIAGHGLYTWGADLDVAYRHVEIFEFLFQLVGRRIRLEPFK